MSSQKRLFAIMGIIAGFLLVQACGRQLPEEASCNFVQNQNMQRVSWGKNVPVDIYIDESVPGEYYPAVKEAIQQWNDQSHSVNQGQPFFRLRSGNPGSARPAQDNYTKIYVMNEWEDGKQAEQARTTVYWSGSQIYEADIRINNKNFEFYSSNTPSPQKVHLPSLLVHEFGHVLGMAHNTNKESVMQASLANGRSRTELSGLDIKSLECEY